MGNEDRIRELVKAAALILDELNRLDDRTDWVTVVEHVDADTTAPDGASVDGGELAMAAAMYASPVESRFDLHYKLDGQPVRLWCANVNWPWDAESFKPGETT